MIYLMKQSPWTMKIRAKGDRLQSQYGPVYTHRIMLHLPLKDSFVVIIEIRHTDIQLMRKA